MALRGAAQADLVEYRDKAEWQAAVGEFATLDFTGFQNGEVLSDQYSDLGVLFPDGNDTVRLSPSIFLNDGWGVKDNDGPITIHFDTPRRAFAADYPGFVSFFLYRTGDLVGHVDFLPGGVGNFAGVVSEVTFDMVEVVDVTGGDVLMDDLYFSIPSPGSIALLIATCARTGSRRRRI